MLLGAGVVAGTANLLNLLDLRPGRALKSGHAARRAAGRRRARRASPPARSAPPPGCSATTSDERMMLGDSGANALGALLGVALAARTGPLGRAGVLAVLAGLTAASEKVSFTAGHPADPRAAGARRAGPARD